MNIFKPPGGAQRPGGGSMSRFAGHAPPHADRDSAALRPDHPALSEARTIFPTSVIAPGDKPVLISGHNNAKTGAFVAKGAWRGMPIYTLTLEERATCPQDCAVWAECYGNAMPLAKRHVHGPELVAALDNNLHLLAREHRLGFVVRLHVLGDFYSEDYAWRWLGWLDAIRPLRVFVYTAHRPSSDTGQVIEMANQRFPGRCVIRFSGAPDTPAGLRQATTIWRQPEGRTVPEGIVCPAQTGATQACGTCGLCWSPAAADKRIVFIGHGMKRATGPRLNADRPAAAIAVRAVPAPAALPAPAAGADADGPLSGADVFFGQRPSAGPRPTLRPALPAFQPRGEAIDALARLAAAARAGAPSAGLMREAEMPAMPAALLERLTLALERIAQGSAAARPPTR